MFWLVTFEGMHEALVEAPNAEAAIAGAYDDFELETGAFDVLSCVQNGDVWQARVREAEGIIDVTVELEA